MNLILTLPLALAAGMLTIFSPCVLPLAPIVVASARARDPRGPIALGFGLAATFGIVGGVLASFGVEFGDFGAGASGVRGHHDRDRRGLARAGDRRPD